MTNVKRRCLLDMDGVLVDFNGGACRLHKKEDPYLHGANRGLWNLWEALGLSREEFFSPLGEEFWANLEPYPWMDLLVEMVSRAFGGSENVCLMTSPVRTAGCAEGKIRWIRKHLPGWERRFLIGPCKQFAASPSAWLVDDSDENVRKFKEWGGNTVLFPRPWNSLFDHPGYPPSYLSSRLPTKRE